jgi:hypothetical protein
MPHPVGPGFVRVRAARERVAYRRGLRVGVRQPARNGGRPTTANRREQQPIERVLRPVRYQI